MTKLVFLFFISAGIGLHAQTPDCKKWKNGTFMTFPSMGQPNYIVRNGLKQLEYNSITKTQEELMVRWLNPCSYELTRTKKNLKKNEKHPGIILTVTILDSYETHCLIFVSSNLPGDIGYFDCMYFAPDIKDFLIAP